MKERREGGREGRREGGGSESESKSESEFLVCVHIPCLTLRKRVFNKRGSYDVQI